MARTIDDEIHGLLTKAIKDMPGVSQMDKDYVLAERWVCEKSPTNAHHWVEDLSIELGMFRCKYCHETRRFSRSYVGRKFPNHEEV